MCTQTRSWIKCTANIKFMLRKWVRDGKRDRRESKLKKIPKNVWSKSSAGTRCCSSFCSLDRSAFAIAHLRTSYSYINKSFLKLENILSRLLLLLLCVHIVCAPFLFFTLLTSLSCFSINNSNIIIILYFFATSSLTIYSIIEDRKNNSEKDDEVK